MKSMLARLEKADTETYHAWKIMHTNMSEGSAMSDAWLQAVLQDAITSRGWLWTLSAEDKGHPTGAPYTCHLWDEDINEMVMDISGGSPAGALLAAYLAAIEVQA